MLREKSQWCSRLCEHHNGSNLQCIIKAQDLYLPSFLGTHPNKELVIFVSYLATLLMNAQPREVLNPRFLFLQWNPLDPLKEEEVEEGPLVQLEVNHFPQEGVAGVEEEINQEKPEVLLCELKSIALD